MSHWLCEMAIAGRQADWHLAMENARLVPLGEMTSIRPWKANPEIKITAATAHECAGMLYRAVYEEIFKGAPQFEDENSIHKWMRATKAKGLGTRTAALVKKADYCAMLELAAAVERERILALKDWPAIEHEDPATIGEQRFDTSGEYFASLYRPKEMTDAMIRDHWQSLSEAHRQSICPSDWWLLQTSKKKPSGAERASALADIVKKRRRDAAAKSKLTDE
jgi:hypothetical protein